MGWSYNRDVNLSYLAALKITDPPAFRARVREALRTEKTIPSAATSLGVGRATLFRWLSDDPTLRLGLDLPDRPGPRKRREREA